MQDVSVVLLAQLYKASDKFNVIVQLWDLQQTASMLLRNSLSSYSLLTIQQAVYHPKKAFMNKTKMITEYCFVSKEGSKLT
jgi:hypothetical protein